MSRLDALLQLIDEMPPEEKRQLLDYLQRALPPEPRWSGTGRQFGRSADLIDAPADYDWMTPLPETLWNSDDELLG